MQWEFNPGRCNGSFGSDQCPTLLSFRRQSVVVLTLHQICVMAVLGMIIVQQSDCWNMMVFLWREWSSTALFVVKAESRPANQVWRKWTLQSSTTFSMTLLGAMNSHIQAKGSCPARKLNLRPSAFRAGALTTELQGWDNSTWRNFITQLCLAFCVVLTLHRLCYVQWGFNTGCCNGSFGCDQCHWKWKQWKPEKVVDWCKNVAKVPWFGTKLWSYVNSG